MPQPHDRQSHAGQSPSHHRAGHHPYGRFLAMVATSTVAMFALMYLNTYSADHILFSETRFWMAFTMGATMAVIMLLFMWSMYHNPLWNGVLLAAAVVVFAVSLWLVRSQITVDDTDYMKAMIPHHSIAVMTSERAHIRDPRVRELAKGIIVAQRREIAEMKYLIHDIARHGVRTSEHMPDPETLRAAGPATTADAPSGSAPPTPAEMRP